ncbi:hypothetical protein [Geodermatophilus ruber]|uniref:Small secreted domain n=1 Tax=Geodermatophilus ruber TaxID=504800 RepID=A0A1I3ZCV4_9ACTN|nr:hypothetical protein [Geodermatophilus ruber]SFK41887.1 hypothetical protein SAMN04488085_101478 [Geodermatophilus ruber]
MNTWVARGLQTALFTGGLLAVGAGVASASDSLELTVPVTVTGNAIGILGDAATAAPPPAAAPGDAEGDALLDVTVPVTVTGNAIAVLGNATAPGGTPAPAHAADADGLLDADVPLTVCGNAVGVLGDAAADCAGTGPDGNPAPGEGSDGGVLEVDVPMTVCGNAVGGLGDASAGCTIGSAPAPGDGGAPGNGPDGGDRPDTRPAASAGEHAADPRGTVLAGRSSGTADLHADTVGGALAYTGAGVAVPALAGLLTLAVGLGLTAAGRHRAGRRLG